MGAQNSLQNLRLRRGQSQLGSTIGGGGADGAAAGAADGAVSSGRV